MWRRLSPGLRVGLVVGVLALGALAWQHPSVYERGRLVGRWLGGGTPAITWRQVAVLMAPYFWRPQMRDWLQPTVPAWVGELAGYEAAAGEDFTMHSLLEGPAGSLEALDCHYSILQAGTRPHPPHQHMEEELIVPLVGQARIIRVAADGSQTVTTLGRGQFAYHAANDSHTIEAVGPEASEYVVFKWKGRWELPAGGLASQDFDFSKELTASAADGFSTRVLLEAATGQLGLLHAHVSALAPDGGYDPHRDLHDIAIVLLEGQMDTLGKQVNADAVVFCPADCEHGMRNPAQAVARYLVFEFHPAAEM